MKAAIIKLEDNSIVSMYDGPADISKYGGPWGNSDSHIHADIPVEMGADLRYLSVTVNDGVAEFAEDSTAKAAAASADASTYVEGVIQRARSEGDRLINKFAAENVMLGITADGKTGQVRKALSEVMSALQSGSLKDAIEEVRAIPAPKKDAKYITDVRLLSFINQLETYLGMTLSEEL